MRRRVNTLVRASDSAQHRAVERATSRAGVMAGPVIGWVCELGAASALHAVWGTDPVALPWITAGLTGSTLACSWLVWHVSRDRSPVGRMHATMTSALVGAHLLATTVFGPLVRPLIDLWAWAGGTLAATWVIRIRVANSDTDGESGRRHRSWWDELAAQSGIEGAKFKPKMVGENRVKGRLEMPPGETIEDAQKSTVSLASALGVPRNGVRLVEDPNHAGAGELTVVRKDMLRETVHYTAPSRKDESSAEPMRVGVYEDGEPMELPMHVPNLGSAHLLIMGMNGAGKTEGALTLTGEKFTRTDVYTIVVDTVKGAQTLLPILPGLDFVIQTEDGAHRLVTALKERTIAYRATYLGRRRLKMWEAGCGIPRLDIHVEEGGGLFLGNGDFVRLMERARSVGIHITVSLQRPSYVSMDVAARSQFSLAWCFGVKDIDDARFALPDSVLDAGADPSMWQNTKPGYSLLVGPGIDTDRYTMTGRAAITAPGDLDALAHYNALHGAGIDEGTARTFGDLYTNRTPVASIMADFDRAEPALLPPDPVSTPRASSVSVPADVPADDEDVPNVDDMLKRLPDDERPDPYRPLPDDPEPTLLPDIDDELPDAAEIEFGTPRDETKVSPEEANAMLDAALAEFQAAGRTEVRGSDLAHVAVAAQRSAAWIYKRLHQHKALEQTDAGFTFVRDLVPAA